MQSDNHRQLRHNKPPVMYNGCRHGAQYAIGISADKSVCVAEITRYRTCANYVIRSQWAAQYAIAVVVPMVYGTFIPNDFDSRSGARLMTGRMVSDIQHIIGDQRPVVIPKIIFELTLKKLDHKEVVIPSIRSVGRNAAAVRRDVTCRLPVIIPYM